LSSQALDLAETAHQGRWWWWLPPVVWPSDQKALEALIAAALAAGARRFVLNAPWQAGLFSSAKGLWLWAGPFCNLTNPLAVDQLRRLGFCGAIVSPELGRADIEALARWRPLPLGIVVYGDHPLCLSRIKPSRLDMEKVFTSPKGENAWMRVYGSDVWVFPGWRLDLRPYKADLAAMGYGLWVSLLEVPPQGVTLLKRPGPWNWDLGLK
jgi:putative protease